MIKRGLALSLVLGLGSIAQGGAVLDVVPAPSTNPGQPAGSYAPDEEVAVELTISQDSGAEHLIRLLKLHFDSSEVPLVGGQVSWDSGFEDTAHYEDESAGAGPPGHTVAYVGRGDCLDGSGDCNFAEGCTSGAVCAPSVVFKLGPRPVSMVAMPANQNPVTVATLSVTMPSALGTYRLDALNSAAPDADLRAALSFGFGCGGSCNAVHPDSNAAITFWRAGTGRGAPDLSGGTFDFVVSVCGDGLLASVEGCDDSNTDPDDGCSSSCAVENGWECSGEPSVCDTICGDNIQAGAEECDDGSQCTDGTDCTADPSVCVAIGDGSCAPRDGDLCSAACIVEVDDVEFGTWLSVGGHGGTVGDVGMVIVDTGAYVEPRRSGINKIVVNFSDAIDPTTAGPASVGLAGLDAGGALSLVGTVITTSFNSPDNTQMEIVFTPKLPGSEPSPATSLAARYTITLTGITSAGGSPVTGTPFRCLMAVLGDVWGVPNGSGAVTSADPGITRSLAAQGIDPIDPTELRQLRADVNGDGKITTADFGLVRSMAAQGRDGTGLACP